MRAKVGVGYFLLLASQAPWSTANAESGAGAGRAKQRARFHYEKAPGTEQCPDERAMRRSVEGYLGYDPFDQAAGLQVRCRMEIQRAKWVAVLDVSDRASGRSGERRLVSNHPNCSELADAAALAIAIAIDPLLPKTASSSGRSQNEEARAPSRPDEGSKAPTTAVGPGLRAGEEGGLPPASHEATEPLTFSIGAGGSLSLGLQPTEAFGLSLILGARRGAWSLAVEGKWRAPSHLDELGGTIAAQLFSAALIGCGHWANANICVLAESGAVVGRADGYLRSSRDTTLFVAPGLRIGWYPFHLGNGSILIHATGLVPVVRTTLWIDPRSVWNMPPVAAEAGISGFFAFP